MKSWLTIPKSWLILLIVTLSLSLFFRFADLKNKVYSADEVRSNLRLSGYTSIELVESLFNGQLITAETLQTYQHPNPEKNLGDALKSLSGNPEHPPLYYLLSRWVMQIFPNPISARFLSIFFAILTLPATYFLCVELFGTAISGWVGMLLISISPYQILLSQLARQYTLWGLLTILATGLLLKALKSNRKKDWIYYGGTLVAGFYTHLFFLLVAFGHFLYIIILEKFKISKTFINYFVTSFISFLLFTPWVYVIVSQLDRLGQNTQYYEQFKTSLVGVLKQLIVNLGSIFADFHNQTQIDQYLDYFAIVLVGYCGYLLWKNTPSKTALLIMVLLVPTLGVQLSPNQGLRAYQARYFLVAFMAIQLLVTYGISYCITGVKKWQQWLGKITLITLITLGVISGTVIAKIPDWETGTASSNNLLVAPIINQSTSPLVITDANHSFILALSYVVKPETTFQLFNSKTKNWKSVLNIKEIQSQKTKYNDIFICYPSDEMKSFLSNDLNIKVEPAYQDKKGKSRWLYRLSL